MLESSETLKLNTIDVDPQHMPHQFHLAAGKLMALGAAGYCAMLVLFYLHSFLTSGSGQGEQGVSMGVGFSTSALLTLWPGPFSVVGLSCALHP